MGISPMECRMPDDMGRVRLGHEAAAGRHRLVSSAQSRQKKAPG
jgi:hypothetical protein